MTRLPIQEPAWWKEQFVYQIYPSSFKDANGDGFGDLRGITSKLDYLKQLGVDMLWLCPIYQSPMVDMGYDISDYEKIQQDFGTMEDWEELVFELKKRDMKIIHDLVINHSSDQHHWFKASRESKDNPHRDFYIWRPGKIDEQGNKCPPNNWASIWGGSAWEYDSQTDEYYLHLFSPQQPDLNFTSPALMKAVKEMMRFWLDKGISGFRLDAINFISKPMDFPDAPIVDPKQPYQPAFSLFNHGPRIHEYLQKLQADVMSHYDAFTVGEAAFTTPEQAVDYVRQDRKNKEMQMIFQTEHVDLYGGFEEIPQEPRDYAKLANVIAKWQTYMMEHESWQSVFLSNHDQPRPINNILQADPKYRNEAAKLLCLFLCTQAGTLYCYQGEELGMMNAPEDWPIEEYKDLVSQKYWHERQEELRKETGNQDPDMTQVQKAINRKARDNARTPIPWDSTPKAGFTTGEPWMRINEDNKVCNAADQVGKEGSVWSFWRDTVKLRKATQALVYGRFELNIDAQYPTVISYTRKLGGETWLFVSNFGSDTVEIMTDSFGLPEEAELVCHTLGKQNPAKNQLQPYEGRLYRL